MLIKNAVGIEMNQKKVFDSLKYYPHNGQWQVHKSNTRFRYLCCGRRWGKTLIASKELFQACCKADQWFWVCAPTYSLCEKTFRVIHKDFRKYYPHWIEKVSESEMKIILKNNTIIECKSADNPNSLLGEGLNGLIVDEAARIKDSVWHEYLRPTLVDKQGWGLFISTPKGQNWFYQGYIEGQQHNTDTESWNFTTADNPYIAKEEIEAARKSMPDRAFQQEILGIFLGNIGGVFRNVRECITLLPMRDTGEGGVGYIIGIDLAKYQDFTVIIVIDKRQNNVIYFDKFNQIDYTLQEKRILNVYKKFNNPDVYVDATGVGDRVVEELAKNIPNIHGIKFTGSSKNEIIDNLSLMIENKQILYPEIPELINELNIYEYEMTKMGNVRLNAPSGYHDDCVIALALAAYGLRTNTFVDNFFIA